MSGSPLYTMNRRVTRILGKMQPDCQWNPQHGGPPLVFRRYQRLWSMMYIRKAAFMQWAALAPSYEISQPLRYSLWRYWLASGQLVT